MILEFQRRSAPPTLLRRITTLIMSTSAALLVGAVFLLANGFDPMLVYAAMVTETFGSLYGISDTLVSATPLVFTGLAAAVAFRFKIYNVGAEGQLIVGGICAAGSALSLNGLLPGPVILVISVAAGAFGGMAWALIPTVALAKLKTNEIITTLLMNYIAIFLARYLIFGSNGLWRDKQVISSPQGAAISPDIAIPTLWSSGVTVALIFGVLCAFGISWILRSTHLGLRLAIFGDSRKAARYAGISTATMVIVILSASSALAGLAGAEQVLGRAHRLNPSGIAVGFGYSGIIVAALARYNPVGVLPVAILFGALTNAGDSLQSLSGGGVPSAISTILEALILIFVLGSEVSLNYQTKIKSGLLKRNTSPGLSDHSVSSKRPVVISGSSNHEDHTTGSTHGLYEELK